MPHRCTKCGRIYPDGDSRILKGCECGNNRFEYVPKERKKKVNEEREAGETEKSGEKAVDVEGVESVKILSPGMYEINLEKVFSRDEIVIALQEEGRYAIHLPSLVGRLGKCNRGKKGRRGKKREE